MPARYRRPAPYPRRSPVRRRTIWTTYNQTDNGKASNVVTAHDLLADLKVAGVGLYGSTIAREILTLAVAPGGVGDSAVVGIIVAPSTATTADLNPTTSPELDWMFLHKLMPDASGATIDATFHYEFDLKARRRLRALDSTCWFVWQALTTTSVSLNQFGRVLVQLP